MTGDNYVDMASKLQLDSVLQAMREGKSATAALDLAIQAEIQYQPPGGLDYLRAVPQTREGAKDFHRVVRDHRAFLKAPPPPYWTGAATGGRVEEEGLAKKAKDAVDALPSVFDAVNVGQDKATMKQQLNTLAALAKEGHVTVFEQPQDRELFNPGRRADEFERRKWVDVSQVVDAPPMDEPYMEGQEVSRAAREVIDI